MARRQEDLYKLTLLRAGVLELLFGTVSLALALAAGQQYYQRVVQVAAIITFLSGVYAVALHRATSAAAYYGSAFIGCASTIVGLIVPMIRHNASSSTPLGLFIVIALTMTLGMTASAFHMTYAISVVVETHIENHDQVRTPRPDLGTVEGNRVPAGQCWIVNWLHSWMNPNRTQNRIEITRHDDENKTGHKIGVDAAKTSGDLIAHVIASYDPEPLRYDDITESHQL